MRTPQIVLTPLGRRYPAISIPGVGQVRGVLIDNPSGAWLLLRPTNDYIPPYTIGWARSFTGGVASVDIAYEAPSGEELTLVGDLPVVVLDTEPVPDSSGSASGNKYIEHFTTGVLWGGKAQDISPGNGIFFDNTVPGVANKRIRLLNVYGVLGGETEGAAPLTHVQLNEIISASWTGRTVAFKLGGAYPPWFYQNYPLGTGDCRSGAGFGITLAFTNVSFVNLQVGFDYQVI